MRKRQNSNKINYKRFIKDFNTLFECSQTEQWLYQSPKSHEIEQKYDNNLLKNKTGQKYSICCHIDEFKNYGPGIYLMFKSIKMLIFLFVIVSIFAVINVGLLASGQQYSRTIYKTNTFEAKIAMTTVGNIQQRFQSIVPIINFIGLVLFTAGVVYWKERESFEVLSCSQVRVLPSYYTVILTQIPNGYSQSSLKQFLQTNFGNIKEIFSVKEFKQDLFHYKQINDIIDEYKIQRSLVCMDRQHHNCLTLISLFNQFYYYYIKMKDHKIQRYQPASAFITFTDVSTRQRCLQAYGKHGIVTNCCQSSNIDEQLLFKGDKLKIEPCKMQPDGINWENVSLSTRNMVLRILFQFALLIIVLAVSIAIIFLLALAQTNLVSSKYSNYSRNQIIALNDSIATKYFCLSLSINDFSDEYQLCQQYSGLFIKIITLSLILPILISIFKFLFTELMKNVVVVRRHSTEIKKLQSQIVITFVFYFCISGILQLVSNMQIAMGEQTVISINRFFSSLFSNVYSILPIGTVYLYTDFTTEWYFTTSAKIALISLVSFNISSIFNIVYSVIRKYVCQHIAKKQPTNKQMDSYLKGEVLQIQFIYALALNIIFFTLLFSAVMPILWIFGLFSLILLYWSYKLIFIRYCQMPLIFSHSINHLVIIMVLFGVCFSCLMAPLLLGGVMQTKSVSQRYIRFMYYPILGTLIVLYMFFKKYLLKLFLWINTRFISNIEQIKNRNRLPTIISRISSISNQLPSYSMHDNKYYEPVLKILYTMNLNQRNRATFMLNPNLNQFLFKETIDNLHKNSFKELLVMIKEDRLRFDKAHINSYLNPFHQNQKKIKEIYKIYKQTKTNPKQPIGRQILIEKINPFPVNQLDNIIQNGSSQSGKPSSDLNKIEAQEDEAESDRRIQKLLSVETEQPKVLHLKDVNKKHKLTKSSI